MSKTLTLSLNKKLIIEAVKADTYITGAIDKSSDGVKNAALAYNEQAGDDQYHERKLTRTLAGAVGSLEANLAEFVDSSTENGISDTLAQADTHDGAFTITVLVSDRYNNGLAYPIAQLSQEYIVNKMLYYWWQSIRPALAKDYLAFSTESLTNIRMCLAKKAPNASSANYEDVTGEVSNAGTGTVVTVASIALSDGKYTIAKSSLATALAANNMTVECSDPSVALAVGDGGTDPLFNIGYTPYSLTISDINKLLQVTATNVEFTPSETPASGAVLIITYRAAS